MILNSSNHNIISHNNFIANKKHAFFIKWDLMPSHNSWCKNYWDDWSKPIPRPILGKIRMLPWVNFDWRPLQEPVDSLSKNVFTKHMFLCHIIANGTGASLWLSGVNFNGTAIVLRGTTYLTVNGYAKLTSLTDSNKSFTVTGKQLIIFNGYFGSFTFKKGYPLVSISMNGVALLVTVISFSCHY